jgi:hypothetical protein
MTEANIEITFYGDESKAIEAFLRLQKKYAQLEEQIKRRLELSNLQKSQKRRPRLPLTFRPV